MIPDELKEERSKCFEKYLGSVYHRDFEALRDVFDKDAIYIDSFGAGSKGIDEILEWFGIWSERNTLKYWGINMFHFSTGHTVCAEWEFDYDHCGKSERFLVLGMAIFNDEGKIRRLVEYRAAPYRCRYHPQMWRNKDWP